MKLRNSILIALALCVGFILFTVGTGVLMGVFGWFLTALTGFDFVTAALVLMAVSVLWTFLPDRFKALHRPYEIRGEALIDAPVAVVWDTVLPQPGKEHFLSSISQVTAVEGRPDRLDLHTTHSGFNGPLPALEAVVEEVETNSYYRLSYLNVKAYPLWAGDLVTSEYFLERADDKTKLTMIETLDKLRPLTVLCLIMLNPCRDSTVRIKALCEGTPDQSWMTWMSENLSPEEARTANGRAAQTVAILACVFLTLICILMYFYLFAFVKID